MNNLGNLPPEIISLIICHLYGNDLYQCALINKLFYAATTPLLWQLVFTDNVAKASRLILSLAMTLNPLGGHIRYVRLDSYRWTDPALLLLIKHTRLLEELFISKGKDITDASFEYLPRYCPHIKNLTLCSASITQRSLKVLDQGCHQLAHLTLSYCDKLPLETTDTYSTLAHCPLETLDITWQSNSDNYNSDFDEANSIYDDDDDDNDNDNNDFEIHSEMWKVAKRSTRVPAAPTTDSTTTRQQQHLMTHMTIYTLTTDMLQRLITTANHYYLHHPCRVDTPFLTTLSLSGFKNVDDNAMLHLLQSWPHPRHHLRHLAVLNGAFHDPVLDAIARYFPRLITLDISSYDNKWTTRSIRRLIRHCRKLMLLIVEKCEFNKTHFPEAAPHCFQSLKDPFYGVTTELHYLDQQAINDIRQRVGVES